MNCYYYLALSLFQTLFPECNNKLNSLFAAREHVQDRARPDVSADKNTKQ